ncbi:DUF4238 domain-containing protein [Vibrio rhizosphaerae]|uniref:DUF4238 domain-containing protein n=1 Tax=Vibrio rhizosphaerae TaxID=398736 RepID=A0ABU4J0I4_9VIBR|nr:DUF4238 domain-containing protein [Vibrio rhizosphaerae]MDW6094024.1 DUF4238 domain-containing protein [Vibrio rhizosphaerae]
MSEPRIHHYLSQCYLKGFTKDSNKKSKLTVIDLKSKKHFETVPRNVGGVRDFNRLDIPDGDPNHIEKELSKFENVLAKSLEQLELTKDFSGETRDNILYFMALINIREPMARKFSSNSLSKINNWADIWPLGPEGVLEAQKKIIFEASSEHQMISDSEILNLLGSGFFNEFSSYSLSLFGMDVSLENIPALSPHDLSELNSLMEKKLSKQLLTMVAEFAFVKFFHDAFKKRDWILLDATDCSDEFITTDLAIYIDKPSLNDKSDIPPSEYTISEAMVIFPASKNMCLMTSDEGGKSTISANSELIAELNSYMMCNTYGRVFSSSLNFYLLNKSRQLISGAYFLEKISDASG